MGAGLMMPDNVEPSLTRGCILFYVVIPVKTGIQSRDTREFG